MKRTLRILGVFLLCLFVFYDVTILRRHLPLHSTSTALLEDFSSLYPGKSTLQRPHVVKYAVIVESDDGRLDELGGPDHW